MIFQIVTIGASSQITNILAIHSKCFKFCIILSKAYYALKQYKYVLGDFKSVTYPLKLALASKFEDRSQIYQTKHITKAFKTTLVIEN